MTPLLSDSQALLQRLRSVTVLREQALKACHIPAVRLGDVHEIVLEHWRTWEAGRLAVGLGGFPASGKTTGAKAIVDALNERRAAPRAAHIPMDGFHFSHAALVSAGLDGLKGSLTTYDLQAYVRALEAYKQERDVSLFVPDYDRITHDVVPRGIEIGPDVDVVVTEGIYVGYKEGGWEELRGLLDLLFYVDATPEECADRIVERNLRVGRTVDVVEKKLSNDFDFMERSIRIMRGADYIVKPPEAAGRREFRASLGDAS